MKKMRSIQSETTGQTPAPTDGAVVARDERTLEEMERACAPQYGSAKDPVNMEGFIAGGLLRGDHPHVDVETVLAAPADQRPFLLDVRTAQEFSEGSIPGAVNISVDELRARPEELPRDRDIAAYCQVGKRGYLAIRILLPSGFAASNIGGGFKTYKLFCPNESST